MVNILQNNPSDFEGIKEWDYKENFYILDTEYGDLRIHYVDEGSENDKTVLLLHGEPDWVISIENLLILQLRIT